MPLLFCSDHVLPLPVTHVVDQPEAIEIPEWLLVFPKSNFAASILWLFLDGLGLEEFV